MFLKCNLVRKYLFRILLELASWVSFCGIIVFFENIFSKCFAMLLSVWLLDIVLLFPLNNTLFSINLNIYASVPRLTSRLHHMYRSYFYISIVWPFSQQKKVISSIVSSCSTIVPNIFFLFKVHRLLILSPFVQIIIAANFIFPYWLFPLHICTKCRNHVEM